MSFSSDVKEELARHFEASRHCQIAEIAAILCFLGRIENDIAGNNILRIYTENLALAKKYFALIKKTFAVNPSITIRQNAYLHKGHTCVISIIDPAAMKKVLAAVKWDDREELVNRMLVKSTCCKRSFLRGSFLAAGSMSDPEKAYHFEIVCAEKEKSQRLMEIINTFQMDAKVVQRKKCYVVYLKEGAQIVDMLNIMGAHVALMDLENVRILKEMRNFVNRQVNCETANINKTVNAALKHIDDITFIKNSVGFDSLSDALKDIAKLRLEYPEASLKELGMMLCPVVGKSGVNHRLRKLSSIAEALRKNDD